MEVEVRDLPIHFVQVKAADDDTRTIEGYASVFGGTPDAYDDLIVKGAFAESLRVRTPKFLDQHDQRRPIGKVISLVEDDHGLYGKWRFANTAKAREAYEDVKEGLVEGLSIGFIAKDYEYNNEGIRVLKTIDLREISVVTIPANDDALITVVKTAVPITQLLEQAGEVFRTVAREAKALRDRRASDLPPRKLNDQQLQAIADYLAEAKALHEELSALVVVEPEAKAPDFGEIEFALAERRARLGRYRLKESA